MGRSTGAKGLFHKPFPSVNAASRVTHLPRHNRVCVQRGQCMLKTGPLPGCCSRGAGGARRGDEGVPGGAAGGGPPAPGAAARQPRGLLPRARGRQRAAGWVLLCSSLRTQCVLIFCSFWSSLYVLFTTSRLEEMATCADGVFMVGMMLTGLALPLIPSPLAGKPCGKLHRALVIRHLSPCSLGQATCLHLLCGCRTPSSLHSKTPAESGWPCLQATGCARSATRRTLPAAPSASAAMHPGTEPFLRNLICKNKSIVIQLVLVFAEGTQRKRALLMLRLAT